MKKMNNRKGFTLAELLIVVAIIAVLVAIAVPVFTSQLEKSREAVDMSNLRSAYAEALTEYMANGAQGSYSADVTAHQTQASWQNTANGVLFTRIDGVEASVSASAKTVGSTWTVTVKSTASGGTSVGIA